MRVDPKDDTAYRERGLVRYDREEYEEAVRDLSEREGWVVPQFRLPVDEIARMRDALDALIRANPGVRPEKLVSAHVEGEGIDSVALIAAIEEEGYSAAVKPPA